MYHYIYNVRYFLIYKNDDVNEKNEKNEENKKIKNDNKYHIVLENMIVWKYNNKLNECISVMNWLAPSDHVTLA